MPDGKLIEVISKQAFEQIDELYVRLTKAFDLVAQFEKSLPRANVPSSVSTSYKQLESSIKSVNNQQTAYQNTLKTLVREKKKLALANSEENKFIQKNRYETQKLNKETKLQQVITSGLAGAYEKLNAKLNQSANEYRDLAVRKELGVKLTDREIKRMEFLEKRILKYDAALKKVDAQMGRHQRNVGNYKSAYDGLGFSIAQLTREAPAFANSMQTGFMAISNNIPMLVDEINRLKTANQQLAASGKPTVSILSRLGGAILSWQTLISVGVTLLTVYGAKLFDMAFGLSESEKALKEEREELEKNNKELEKNIRLRERMQEKNKELIDGSQIAYWLELTKGIEESARAEAVLLEIYERFNEAGLDGIDMIKDQNLLQSDRIQIVRNLLKIEDLRLKIARLRALEEKDGASRAATIIPLQQKIIAIQKENEFIQKNIVELREDENDQIDKTREKVSGLFSEYVKLKKILDQYLKNLSKIVLGEKQEGIPKWLQDLMKWEKEQREREQAEKTKQLRWEQRRNDLLKESFIDLGTTVGLQQRTVADLFDTIIDGFGDTSEAAEAFSNLFIDAVGAMTAAENARINQRIDKLQEEKELAIAFAGDSAEAREAVEERYTRRIAQLKARQAQNTKNANIIQSIINTATAITKTFAELGFPAGVPAAAIVGALGAAQTAIIASQPIPQFKEGVRSFEGGLAVVGDGGKNEPITDRQGRLLGVSPDRPTLVDLPSGANVYKDYEDFNKELNATLGLNDINPFGASVYPRINKRSGNNGIDTKALEKAFGNAIKSRPSTVVTMDKNGFRTFVRSQYGQSEMLNNRTSFKGMDV